MQKVKVIDLFAPKLVLGISDELSSTGDIERVRVVGEIVNAYNARVADSGPKGMPNTGTPTRSAGCIPL